MTGAASARRRSPRSPVPRLLLALLLASLSAGAGRVAADAPSTPRLTQVIVSNTKEALVLFARLAGPIPGEALLAVQEGVPLQLDFDVEVYRERRMWPDQVMAELTLSHSVRYDTLREEYVFTADYKGPAAATTTTSPSEVQRLMSTIDAVPVLPLTRLKEERRYYLRVRAGMVAGKDLFDRNILFFSGAGDTHGDWQRSAVFRIGGKREG